MCPTEPRTRLSRIENAAYVIDQLRALGFDPNPSSRLIRMRKVWERGPHSFGTPDFWIALESDRDMVQLGFIFEQLGVHAKHAKFLSVVERVLDDSPLAQDDRKQSRGRDAQFELYLAAICQKARMAPVGYDEPDVTCVVNGIPFCMAAKRIKNVQQAADRIKKAAGQVIKSQRLGVIALDMSIGFNRTNAPVVSPLHNQMLDMINETQANQFIDQHEKLIAKYCLGKGILGIVVFDFRNRVIKEQWGQHRFAMWTPIDGNDDENRVYQEFYELFCSVMPNRKETIGEGQFDGCA